MILRYYAVTGFQFLRCIYVTTSAWIMILEGSFVPKSCDIGWATEIGTGIGLIEVSSSISSSFCSKGGALGGCGTFELSSEAVAALFLLFVK